MQTTLERSAPDQRSFPAPPAAVPRRRWMPAVQQVITALIVFGPFATLCVLAARLFGGGIALTDVLLAAVLYVVIGHAVTIGFHRLFTHRSFEARRGLKIALAALGSMSFQGSLIGWVAAHRRHHMYADQPGDPHSPSRPATQRFGTLRGLFHAHLGWFFEQQSTSRARFAADLLEDHDLVVIDKLFVPFCVLTLALPSGVGLAITGHVGGPVAAVIWAGVLRIGLLHQVTWSTNSLCHTFGKRPFRTTDDSTNLAPLAVLSMGEAWHNAHHAFPYLARHGVDPRQVDTSAMFIRLFERLGWASRVRWPDRDRLDARRRAGSPRVPAFGAGS